MLYDTNGYAASSRAGGVLVQQNVRWHNVLARDLDSGEEWMILNTRGVIGRFQLLGFWSDAEKQFVTAGLAFVAVIADTNQDGSLDDRDARALIIADASGRNPRVVSPRDAQVWEVSYDAPTASVFAMIATDTNRDGRFDFNDVAVPYVIRPELEEAARPVVSDDLTKRAQSLLR
ncbi:MAG: hypothetical protein IT436_17675 [Phycisphaerales bacterium]|nr:hypothetical protein [Phycisphaerales bacterium]